MSTVDLLQVAGRALYGEQWQTPLARDLDVTDRTIRYWASGEKEPRGDLRMILCELLRSRSGDLQGLAERIERNEI